MLLATIFDLIILPKRLNANETCSTFEEVEEEEVSSSDVNSTQITFKLFLFNRRSFFAILSSILAMVFMLFGNSIISVQFETIGVAD